VKPIAVLFCLVQSLDFLVICAIAADLIRHGQGSAALYFRAILSKNSHKREAIEVICHLPNSLTLVGVYLKDAGHHEKYDLDEIPVLSLGVDSPERVGGFLTIAIPISSS
jgi:hypothetical protein